MAAKKRSIFISYARDDLEFALKLGKDLRCAGADIWLDKLDIATGERWDDAIQEALVRCPHFLVVLSPSAVVSENVKDELGLALEEKKKIFPVLYKDCKVPLRVRRIQYSDFTNSYKGGYNELSKALKIELQVKSRDTSAPLFPKGRKVKLRHTPRPVTIEEVPVMLKECDFYCAEHVSSMLWCNSEGRGIVGDFILQKDGQVVYNTATGLTWQRSGSGPAKQLTYEAAHIYVRRLNNRSFAGFTDWRLPTLEEAMSLITPMQQNSGLYVESVFSNEQRWIWTGDTHTQPPAAAWYVDLLEGFCNYGGFSSTKDVRAVR